MANSSWVVLTRNLFNAPLSVTNGVYTFAISSRVLVGGVEGVIDRFDYGGAMVRLPDGTKLCEMEELLPAPPKKAADPLDPQTVDENLRRMRHDQACADLKRAEADGDYWAIRRARAEEERLSNAE